MNKESLAILKKFASENPKFVMDHLARLNKEATYSTQPYIEKKLEFSHSVGDINFAEIPKTFPPKSAFRPIIDAYSSQPEFVEPEKILADVHFVNYVSDLASNYIVYRGTNPELLREAFNFRTCSDIVVSHIPRDEYYNIRVAEELAIALEHELRDAAHLDQLSWAKLMQFFDVTLPRYVQYCNSTGKLVDPGFIVGHKCLNFINEFLEPVQ